MKMEAQQPPALEAAVGCAPDINEGLLRLVEREERQGEVLAITIYSHLDILHSTESIIYDLMVQKSQHSGTDLGSKWSLISKTRNDSLKASSS